MSKKVNKQIIQDLTSKGYELKISHARRYATIEDGKVGYEYATNGIVRSGSVDYKMSHALPRGGLTTVRAFKDGQLEAVAEAQAICSDKDSFCRHVGLRIALGRLQQKIAAS